MEDLEPTDWMVEGSCRQVPSSTFFPSDGVGVEVARRICATCPVKAPCLEYALRHRIVHGVWGGASERERRRIARRRRLEARDARRASLASEVHEGAAPPRPAARCREP